MKSRRCFTVSLIIFLTACGGQVNPVMPSATLTAQKAVPALTQTLAPTETIIPTLRLTETIAPATLKAQQTLEAALQLCPDGSNPTYPYSSFSPNGEWISVPCLDKDVLLKLVKADGQLSWEIPLMSVFHWSSDGNYVYLIPASFWPGADDPASIFIDGGSLTRLDLKNGHQTTVIGDKGPDAYSFSFSPDERFLVYSSHPINFTIHMIDLYSTEDTVFSLPDEYSRAGIFLWSPDGKKVVFTALGKGDWYNSESSFSIYLIDTRTKQVARLLNRPPHKYYADKWLSENKVHIDGFDEPGEFELDVVTQDLTEVTPIPTP